MSTSYSYHCNDSYPTATENNIHYHNSYQQQEKYYQQSYYYTQGQTQYQMSFDNEEQYTQTMYNNNNTAYQMPLFQFDDTSVTNYDNDNNNVLQDDNFSIVTASDLYCNNASPSLLSMTQLTPFSSPSPQISPLINDACMNYYEGPIEFTTSELFVPVHEIQPTINKNKKASNTAILKTTNSASTEKRHVCPVCSHRSKRRHNLIEHMLTHNPQRPKSFLCSHCSRPFARKYDMKRHEKIHTRK